MTVLSWLGAGITIVLFIGTAAVYVRGSADKGTIESLQRSNAALAGELAITNTKCAQLDTRVKALENENEVLRAAVSHSEEIRQLQIDVNELLALVRGLTEVANR